MPDISMCMSSTCPLKDSCYRNPDSGTKPMFEHRLMSLINECPDVTVEDVMCLILERQEYLGQEPEDA